MELVINIMSVAAIAVGYAILRWVLAPRLTTPSRRTRSRGSEGPAHAIGRDRLPAATFRVYPVSDSARVGADPPEPSSSAVTGNAPSLTPVHPDQSSSTHDAA